MYREISSSWFKHWDFILLDLIVLQVIYVVSIMCRNGFVNPYGQDIYRQEAIILCLADICTVFFTEEYSGIMRRGYFQEFKAVLKHVVIVYLMMISYLFLMKRGRRLFANFIGYLCNFWFCRIVSGKTPLENIFIKA